MTTLWLKQSTACTRLNWFIAAPGKRGKPLNWQCWSGSAWFNHHRLMEPLGYIPPAEAEANCYRQLETPVAEPALT
jgi:hypothetical protein